MRLSLLCSVWNLPQLKINNIQKMTWETYGYPKYSNKLKSEVITEITRFENSLFISLNPVWKIDQKLAPLLLPNNQSLALQRAIENSPLATIPVHFV